MAVNIIRHGLKKESISERFVLQGSTVRRGKEYIKT